MDSVEREAGRFAGPGSSRVASASLEDPWLEDRIRRRTGDGPLPGAYVLLWVQKAQRLGDNPAYALAAAWADRLGLPLLALFVLAPAYPGAAPGHFRFMLRGLAELKAAVEARGGLLLLREGAAPAVVAQFARDAAVLVGDAGRLRLELSWRADLERTLVEAGRSLPWFEVETEALVPPDLASPKEEWSAATFRRKIAPLIPRCASLAPPEPRELRADARGLGFDGGAALLARYDGPARAAYPGDRIAEQRLGLEPGETAAEARFRGFLEAAPGAGLEAYARSRNEPAGRGASGLSPYLHFGQIGPRALVAAALARGGEGAEAFVEQLVVRRELAVNFVLRNPAYDRYEGLPAWARGTLGAASRDRRPYLYSRAELEGARTHDPYWNAAQDEMVLSGNMHNYMRMYWGKKILEWTEGPEEAFATILALNDRYSLDGRDPNGYAGAAWCLGKHDRPWKGRPVFGTIRYMNAAGLRRKFDMESYLDRAESLKKQGAALESPAERQ